MKYVFGFAVVALLNTLAACLVYIWLPAYRYHLYYENCLVENITAILFLCAFFIGMFFFFKLHNYKPLALLSAFGLLGFLDELSFGKELFHFSMPRVGNFNIDGAHDFIHLAYEILIRLMNTDALLLSLFFAGLTSLSLTLGLRYRTRLSEAISVLPNHPPCILMLCFVVLVSVSLIIDLPLVFSYALYMFEELFELNAALALIFCCFSVYSLQSGKSTRQREGL